MASAITVWGASRVLNILFGRRVSAPEIYYVALLSAAPGEQADGTMLLEPPATAGYSRVPLLNDALTWGEAGGGVTTSLSSVEYAQAAADWPVITHFALCDSLVGGNVFLYAQFTVPRRVPAGDTARIPTSLLSLAVGSLTTALVSTF